jgi:Dolichyl-phosphate-mannose-protein mannosyltransferase
MVARDFARHGFNLLHPHVNGAGPHNPNYFSGEFSIQSVFAAILYKSFGESDTLARFVTIAFSLAGIYFLYNLIQRHAGSAAASLGAFVYSLLPYHIFFGRVFMPDIPAISLALGGADFLDRWSFKRKWRFLLIAAVFTAAAVLQKLTVIFVGLPLLYIFWLAHAKRVWACREIYVFGAIVGIPTVAWYLHSAALGRQSGFFVMQPFVFARHLHLWLGAGFVRDLAKAAATEMLSPFGALLAVVGLFFAGSTKVAVFWRLWLIGGIILLVLIPDILPENHYYLSLLMPGAAALAGMALVRITSFRVGWPIVIALMALFAFDCARSVLPFYTADRAPRDLGLLLNGLSAPDDVLITESGGSPVVLYFADRRGWLLDHSYDARLLQSLERKGARYYADVFQADLHEHADFFQILNTQFDRLTAENTPWVGQIYDLRGEDAKKAALSATPMLSIDFGDQIELGQFAVRRILDWPPAFEATSTWKCLKPVSANLRVFVHIANAAGETAAQWDHWPSGGGSRPTSGWNTGDIVRERYIAGLPGSLPAGKYQVWIGWFDPVSGPRLPVLRSTAAIQDNRANVGVIRVSSPTQDGWFRGTEPFEIGAIPGAFVR